MSIGERIRTAREAADLTQALVAERIGVTQTAVSYWEADKRVPSLDDLASIAKATGTTLADLIPLSGPPVAGVMVAVGADRRVVWKLPCLSVDMPHPGWMRLVLEPDGAGGESAVTWWRVPDEVRLVEWQPGEAAQDR